MTEQLMTGYWTSILLGGTSLKRSTSDWSELAGIRTKILTNNMTKRVVFRSPKVYPIYW